MILNPLISTGCPLVYVSLSLPVAKQDLKLTVIVSYLSVGPATIIRFLPLVQIQKEVKL